MGVSSSCGKYVLMHFNVCLLLPHLFSLLALCSSVSYMELYNEKINDLLCKSNRNLKISEDNQGNVFVKDLEESITSSSQMVGHALFFMYHV